MIVSQMASAKMSEMQSHKIFPINTIKIILKNPKSHFKDHFVSATSKLI